MTGAAGAARASLPIVHTASRVEDLLAPLVERLRDDAPSDPFTPLTIVVQSRGMQRWLSHQLAERLAPDGAGIAANLAFPFPARFLRDLAAAVDSTPDEAGTAPEPAGEDPWDPDRLVWQVLAVLQEHRDRPELQRLHRYLERRVPDGPDLAGSGLAVDADEADRGQVIDRRAWRFARAVADVLDGYTLTRPGMVRAWSAGDDLGPDGRPLNDRELWQPWLWRQLTDRLADQPDPATRLRQLTERLTDGSEVRLPARLAHVSTFGISALHEQQLAVLTALARHTDLALYVPTVSGSRWEAIGRWLVEDPRGARDPSVRPAAAHPLVASCGRINDDAATVFHHLGLTRRSHDRTEDQDAAPGLLGRLQATLREDRWPVEPRPLAVGDRSVRIHRCHGPARQAEVLRDALLGLLADRPELEPRDILIMTPDIDRYAPLVQAAFVGDADTPTLPVRIADRHLGAGNPVVEALLGVLDLAAGRATTSQVLDLLGRAPIADRFGATPDDLEKLAVWAAGTGIRWGRDREHRVRAGQPPDRVHTWRFGLDRMLLGATMADEDDRVVGDVTPFDPIEGDDVAVVGRLAAACRGVFSAADRLRAPRSVSAWRQELIRVMDELFHVAPADAWRAQEVVAALPDVADGAVPDPTLDLGALRTLVGDAVDRPRGAAGYETGAVTVCAMIPMRFIPHQVVCLLGLDDGAFPRPRTRIGFDLLEPHDRVGDRDRRVEDRALFLEAVLSARQHLVITCTDRDARTGAPHPPAVPLAELTEVLDGLILPSEGAAGATDAGASQGHRGSDAVIVAHPLHAFSPRAFDPEQPDGVRSFDRVARDAAEVARRRDRRRRILVTEPLPGRADDQPPEAGPAVTLDELAGAVGHPTRYLLRRRLDVHLGEDATSTEDHEPIAIDGLRRSALGRELLEAPTTAGWDRAVVASGTVPGGTPGRVGIAGIRDEVARLRTVALQQIAGFAGPGDLHGDPGRTSIDLRLSGGRLQGTPDGVRAVGDSTLRVELRFVRPRPDRLLAAWIQHLGLSAAGRDAVTSLVVTRVGSGTKKDAEVTWFGPLASDPDRSRALAREHLEDLLVVHRQAGDMLLPLFTHASSTFAQTGRLASARAAFGPKELPMFGDGDRDDDVLEAYGADVTLDDVLTDPTVEQRFRTLATTVWGPLEAARTTTAVTAQMSA